MSNMTLIHSVCSDSRDQVYPWDLNLAPSNSNLCRLVIMEGSSPASYEIGTPNRVSRAQSNWARMMQTLALFWEANRMNFVLLAKAEMNTKVSRVSASGALPSSTNHEGEPLQSICLLDGVRSLLGPNQLPIQEGVSGKGSRCNNELIGDNGVGIPGTRGSGPGNTTSAEECSNNEPRKCRGDFAAGAASLQPAEFPVWSDDGTGAALSAGACSGPGPDGDAVSINGLGKISDGGGSVVSSRSRDAESQRRPGHVKRWPAWMVMASMATTSAILTWDQCSEDLQHKLMEAGAREECYLFQYDLDGVPGPSHGFETLPNAPAEISLNDKLCESPELYPDPCRGGGHEVCRPRQVYAESNECPDSCQDCRYPEPVLPTVPVGGTECHAPTEPVCPTVWVRVAECPGSSTLPPGPAWLPSFAQLREAVLPQCLELERPEDESWCCLWRTIIAEETGEILENGPPSCHLDFRVPLDLRVRHWGLPMDFLQLTSFSDFGSLPLRLDLEGNPSDEGQVWVFSTDILSYECLDLAHPDLPDVGSQSDMKRCGAKLSLLTRQLHGHDSRRLDFAELFSPPRVTPFAQKLGLRVDETTVFDLQHGWDVRDKSARQKFRKFQKQRRPKTLVCSPVCKAFSPLGFLNHPKMCPLRLRQDLAEGHLMWDFSLEAAHEQCNNGDYFGIEHPGNATSWRLSNTQELLQREDVALMTFDMCAALACL